MALINRGYVIKDGKIQKSAPKRNVSLQMKIAKSKKKKPRVVSPAKASTTSIARGFKP